MLCIKVSSKSSTRVFGVNLGGLGVNSCEEATDDGVGEGGVPLRRKKLRVGVEERVRGGGGETRGKEEFEETFSEIDSEESSSIVVGG